MHVFTCATGKLCVCWRFSGDRATDRIPDCSTIKSRQYRSRSRRRESRWRIRIAYVREHGRLGTVSSCATVCSPRQSNNILSNVWRGRGGFSTTESNALNVTIHAAASRLVGLARRADTRFVVFRRFVHCTCSSRRCAIYGWRAGRAIVLSGFFSAEKRARDESDAYLACDPRLLSYDHARCVHNLTKACNEKALTSSGTFSYIRESCI